MTIKKLFFIIISLVLTASTHAALFDQIRSKFGKIAWQYYVCKVYDRNVGTTRARLYRNAMAGGFTVGTGLISGISYGGYAFLKQHTQATTK